MKLPARDKTSQTDWARLHNLSDESIDSSDNPILDDDFFAHAVLRLPTVPITLQVNRQLLAWFEAQENSHEHMVQALQEYVEKQQQREKIS